MVADSVDEFFLLITSTSSCYQLHGFLATTHPRAPAICTHSGSFTVADVSYFYKC